VSALDWFVAPMRSLLLALALVAPAWSASSAAEPWTLVRSPHFEVASDAGPAVAAEAARRLERLRDVLGRLLPSPEPEDGPVIHVLLLRDDAEFASLVPADRGRVDDVAGFFLTGTDGPLVAVSLSAASGDAAPERFRTLDHEYAHLHLNASLPAQPVWVAEGLAQALSGGDLEGPQARLAAAPGPPSAARHVDLPLGQLLTIDWRSPTYRGRSSTGAFYAESEELVRWILLRHGLAGLRLFLDAVADGEKAGDAFAARFGAPAWVEAQLVDTPAAPLLQVEAGEPAEPPLVVSVPEDADLECRRGDVLLNGRHEREAQRRFESALRKDPSHAAARAGLAQALLQAGKPEEARRELQRALADRPDDPAALLRYARLLLAEGRDREPGLSADVDAAAVAALEKAVALAPDLADAAELLAHEEPEPLAHRIALLRRSFARDPGRPELGLTLSYLLVQAHDVDAARRVLRRTRDAVRDETYRFLVDHRLSQVREYIAATAEASGRLVRLDCRHDGSLRFTIAPAGGGELALEAPSSRSFFVSGRSGSDQAELACGRLDIPARARYEPPVALGGAGTLISLDLSGEAPRPAPATSARR
jgi:tetratricopeptide (TPR) repeat protein